MRAHRIPALVIVFVLLLTALCGTSAADSIPNEQQAPLTYWVFLESTLAQFYNNFGDTPLAQAMYDATGIEVEFIHPPIGSEVEQFNLMVASGDLCDMIQYDWLNGYAGGPEKAIADNVILPLNDAIDQYAPNLRAVLDSTPQGDKECKTDSGNYYVFPYLQIAERLLIWAGPIVRADYLAAVNLPSPETIDDWHTMLTAFRDQLGLDMPFTTRSSALGDFKSTKVFIGAYGVDTGFYVDDGTIKYGPAEPGYLDWLTTMAQWYAEGLIDPDFTTNDNNSFFAKTTSGRAGAFSSTLGGSMGNLLTQMAGDPSFDLMGVQYPTLSRGDVCEFGQKQNIYECNGSTAISATCSDVARAAAYLDMNYSETGINLNNFGIESVTYEWENGYPKYTDLVMNNPDGLSMPQALAPYIRAAAYSGPYLCDPRYHEQYLSMPQQNQALAAWAECTYEHIMPPVTFTLEESELVARVLPELETYVDELTIKFIMGQTDLSEFEQFVANQRTMGLEELVNCQQLAYERFLDR